MPYQFYLKHKKEKIIKKLSSINYLRSDTPVIEEVIDGYILPCKDNSFFYWGMGGVLDSNLNFINLSKTEELFGGKYEFDVKKTKFIDKEVIYFGPFKEHWGHFITDIMSRLWIIEKYKDRSKILFAYMPIYEHEGMFNSKTGEFLRNLGLVESNFIRITEPTKFKKIIIPERSADFLSGLYYTKEFVNFTNEAVVRSLNKCANLQNKNKIFFSRESTNRWRDFNYNSIEMGFKEAGFEIMYPSNMSVDEQIYYINNAEWVALLRGSIAHNLIFAKNPNTKFIIIEKNNGIVERQSAINSLCNSLIILVDSYIQVCSTSYGIGPFFYHKNRLFKKMMKKTFNEKTKNNINKTTLKQFVKFIIKSFLNLKDKKIRMDIRQSKQTIQRSLDKTRNL